MITGNFSISQALKDSWKLTKKHWVVMIGLMLGFTILNMILGLFAGNEVSAKYVFMQIFLFFFSTYFSLGYLKMYLVASQDEEPEFNLFGKVASRFFPYLGAYILFSIGMVIGICLLIIPGIWFAIRFGMTMNLIADDDQIGVMEAFRKSYELTKGHSWGLLGLGVISFLIILGGVICLIVGVFLAAVWVAFAQVVAYRLLVNESNPMITPVEMTAQIKESVSTDK